MLSKYTLPALSISLHLSEWRLKTLLNRQKTLSSQVLSIMQCTLPVLYVWALDNIQTPNNFLSYWVCINVHIFLLILAFSIWLHNLMCSTFSLHTLYLLQKILRKSLLLVLRIPSRLVWYCICDPLGEKGTVREIIQIGGKRPRTCNIDFLSFSYENSVFSLHFHMLYTYFTQK